MSTPRLPADFPRLPAVPRVEAPPLGRVLIGLFVVAVFGFGVYGWLNGWHLGPDSAVYRAGALQFLHGEPLYTNEKLPTLPDWVSLPFTYPPAATLFFLPLAAIPAGLVWAVVAAASVLALAVVVRAFAGSVSWGAVAGLTVLAAALEPVWKTLFLGQINLLLLALVVLDVLVLCARDSRWGGVLVGIAAAIKLTPLVFVAHLLFTGRWRDALRAVGTFAVLQGVMFVVMPSDAVRYWTKAATDPDRIGAVQWIFNQSLNGMLNRASELAPWSTGAAILLGAVLAIPAVWLVLRLHRRGEAAAALVVTGFYGLLLSPVSWSHHWVWVVPLVVLLLAKRRIWQAVVVTAFFASGVIMVVPNGGREEFDWGPLLFVPGNAYVLAAIVGILGMTARELRISRPLR